MTRPTISFSLLSLIIALLNLTLTFATPLNTRAEPSFPPDPPSCPLCGAHYDDTIASCADAAAAFQDVQQIIFNPAGFIAILTCGCTDTFQSVFPQCVDCFQKTNQTSFLSPDNANIPNLPAAVNGMRQVCALASSLFGAASSSTGLASTSLSTAVTASSTSSPASAETTPSTPDTSSSPNTGSSSSGGSSGGGSNTSGAALKTSPVNVLLVSLGIFSLAILRWTG